MINKECSLCNMDLDREKVFYKNDYFVIIRTKELKNHRERIMVVWKEHLVNIPRTAYSEAILKLVDIGMKVFNYTPKFVIMEGTFATIKHHWHLVATDLNRESDDFEQILSTPWLEVVGTYLERI